MTTRPDNPEGLDPFDPMDDPAYAAGLQAYSDRLRDRGGRPRIRLSDATPSDNPAGLARDVGVTDSPAYRARLQDYSDRLRDQTGHDRIVLFPEDQPAPLQRSQDGPGSGEIVEVTVREGLGRLS